MNLFFLTIKHLKNSIYSGNFKMTSHYSSYDVEKRSITAKTFFSDILLKKVKDNCHEVEFFNNALKIFRKIQLQKLGPLSNCAVELSKNILFAAIY